MNGLEKFSWVWYVVALTCFGVACATDNSWLALATLLPTLLWVILLRESQK